MPEHVHILMSEPPEAPLSKALQALKISASRRLAERPFWQPRYYDFNVFTHNSASKSWSTCTATPVTRGLVKNTEDWPLSTYRHYLLNEPSPFLIMKS